MTTVNNEPQIHMDDLDKSDDRELVRLMNTWKRTQATKDECREAKKTYDEANDEQKEAKAEMATLLKDYQGRNIRVGDVVITPYYQEPVEVRAQTREGKIRVSVKAAE